MDFRDAGGLWARGLCRSFMVPVRSVQLRGQVSDRGLGNRYATRHGWRNSHEPAVGGPQLPANEMTRED